MSKVRNQEIKKLWKLGKTLQEIGEEFGISKQRVHQIVYGTNKGFRKNIKDKVYKRDGYKCQKCGDETKSHLTMNHIIPRIIGGTNEPKNLEVLCFKCNRQIFAELVRKALKFYFEHNKK